jgi:hypothetical protein
MIKWIKKVLRRLGRDDSEDHFSSESPYDEQPTLRRAIGRNRATINYTGLSTGAKIRSSADSDDIQTDEVFSFKVFSAGGGKVIEFRSYDRVKDKSNNRLHLISDDEDFAVELGRIVLFELMRS